MTRINPSSLLGTAFLYPSHNDAVNHAPRGGSAFFVGKPVADFKDRNGGEHWVPYLVSNTHVVSNHRCSVARFNSASQGMRILDFSPSDWVPHHDADVSAICIYGHGDWVASETNFVGTDQFLTVEQISQLSIGAGDEVFMIGRFLNMQGDGIIKPVVRFGSISMETTEFVHNKAMGQDEESFIVEMRSRTGFSGSPVMMYRTDATSISTFHPTNFIYGLLGINWGYIYNEDKENSFMNGVVPAWKILELLEHPTLLKKHAEAEARIKFALSDLGQRIMSAFPGPSI